MSGGRAVARVNVTGVARPRMEAVASQFGLAVRAAAARARTGPAAGTIAIRAPRVGLYQSWTGNMDEGWTRFVLEQYGFAPVVLHNEDVRAGKLRAKFDAIVLPDQQLDDILSGYDARTIRPEYRGGIGPAGVDALREFVGEGGTLVTLGAACDFAIRHFAVPLRNIKGGLTRDEHFAPGTVVRIQVDPTHPIGLGMADNTCGFYNNSPFFELTSGFASQRTTVVARYPNADIVASGWLKGEEHMAGSAAVVEVETNPGRLVLFGLRPQIRAQTHATFPMLFNALYRSTTGGKAAGM